jgi:Holliday junction resolvase RusA-like endonuclease
MLTLDQLVQRIKGEHQRCQTAIALGLLHGRNAGDYLLQAIALVPTEKWNSWLSDHCQMSAKTAATYMQIAQGWPSVDKLSERKSHQPALPRGENDSEKPDVALPERKGGINPPITVNSETVLNPITVNSVDFIPETENQTKNQTENLPTDDSPMWPFASPPVASEKTAASTTSKPESYAESYAESSAKIYSFWIPGNVTPKARPRVTKNGTFFPQRYREWRLKAQGEILMQIHRMNPPLELPLKTAALRIILYGKHRGDGDNAIGSVCDALVSAGVLPSDSLKYLPYGSWRHIKSEETGVKIEIKPLS